MLAFHSFVFDGSDFIQTWYADGSQGPAFLIRPVMGGGVALFAQVGNFEVQIPDHTIITLVMDHGLAYRVRWNSDTRILELNEDGDEDRGLRIKFAETTVAFKLETQYYYAEDVNLDIICAPSVLLGALHAGTIDRIRLYNDVRTALEENIPSYAGQFNYVPFDEIASWCIKRRWTYELFQEEE